MTTCIIYKATNTENGKAYVGYTNSSLSTRRSAHYHEALKRNGKQHFKRALRKYSPDVWTWEVLAECPESETKTLERLLIGAFDTFRNGYNSTKGGDGFLGGKHSEEAKQAISKATKGKPQYKNRGKTPWNKGLAGFRAGRKVSDETKEKQREAMKGRVFSDETKQKISAAGKGRPAPNKGQTGAFAWFTNGTEDRFLRISEAPNNWTRGRSSKVIGRPKQ